MQRILIYAVKLGVKSTTERAWDSRDKAPRWRSIMTLMASGCNMLSEAQRPRTIKQGRRGGYRGDSE